MSYKTISYAEGIHILKGYVTSEVCDDLVSMINEAKQFNQMTPWAQQENPNYIINTPNPKGQTFIDKYVKDISVFANSMFNTSTELVREQTNFTLWPIGCERAPHFDNEHKYLWYTTVLYLNDNYADGEIVFTQKNITIKPEKGDVVVFSPLAQGMEHKIIAPRKNARYTLAVWLQSETPYVSKETN